MADAGPEARGSCDTAHWNAATHSHCVKHNCSDCCEILAHSHTHGGDKPGASVTAVFPIVAHAPRPRLKLNAHPFLLQ